MMPDSVPTTATTVSKDPTGDALQITEHVATVAPRRPVVDELVNCPRRQQLTTMPLVTGLPALGRPERSLPRRRGGTLGGSSLGGKRRVTRGTAQPALELLDPHIKLRDPTIHRNNTSTTAPRPAA
jgi:hypothetical protein